MIVSTIIKANPYHICYIA